jgi:hypothetical protein
MKKAVDRAVGAAGAAAFNYAMKGAKRSINVQKRQRQLNKGYKPRKRVRRSPLRGYSAKQPAAIKNMNNRKSNFTKKVKRVLDSELPSGIMVKEGVGHLVAMTNVPNELTTSRNMQNRQVDITGYDFDFFSLGKFLDAASILFNGKVRGYDYNAFPSTNFDEKKLHLTVEHASASLEITNKTQTNIWFETMVLEPKISTTVPYATMYDEAIQSTNWPGGNIGIGPIVPNNAIPTTSNIGTNPQMFPEFNRQVKTVSKKKILLHPGQQTTLYLQFRGDIEFPKYLEGASSTVQTYAKGITKNVVFRYYRQEGISYPVATPVQAVGNQTIDDVSYGLIVKVKETYKIRQPEITLDANEGPKRVQIMYHPGVVGAEAAHDRAIEVDKQRHQYSGDARS